ncbi:MAG: polymer-forming cytoskeletal protein [Candidatus Dormiibacterota bacterium]|jgi:cytoskeletal protein CcmA (bactofilin family)
MEQTAEKMNASPEGKESVATPKPDRQRLGENSSGGTVTLGVDDRLEGKLIIRSDLVVLGSIEGEVITTGDVSVEATAVVKARLECRNLSIRGRVEGEITAQQRLRLAGSGYLQGNIRVGKLHVEDGATFNGTIAMVSGEA